jgi:hypothetical protein
MNSHGQARATRLIDMAANGKNVTDLDIGYSGKIKNT